jgi:hypothetical protein
MFRVFDSYEAAEDNEISLTEGDYIVKVDTTVDDHWWQGTHTKTRKKGLFPCELRQDFKFNVHSVIPSELCRNQAVRGNRSRNVHCPFS